MIALNQPSPVSNLITTNKVDTDVNNDDDSQSFETPRKHNHSDTEINDTNNITSKVHLKLHQIIYQEIPSTTTRSLKLPPSGKYYLCFQMDGKYAHEAQCEKSRAPNKVIDSIVEIESFEQQYFVLKGLLQ